MGELTKRREGGILQAEEENEETELGEGEGGRVGGWEGGRKEGR